MKRKAPADGGRVKVPAATTEPLSAGASKHKRRKVKDDAYEAPSYYICWAQMIRYPHWPAKVRFFREEAKWKKKLILMDASAGSLCTPFDFLDFPLSYEFPSSAMVSFLTKFPRCDAGCRRK